MPLFAAPVLAPTSSLLTAYTTAPGAGSQDPLLFTAFTDQQNDALTGAPLTAYLAAMGLSYAAGVFTVDTGGVFGLTLTALSVTGPTAHQAVIQMESTGVGGLALSWPPAFIMPAGSADQYLSFGYVDVFADNDNFGAFLTQTAAETDLAAFALGIVRIR